MTTENLPNVPALLLGARSAFASGRVTRLCDPLPRHATL